MITRHLVTMNWERARESPEQVKRHLAGLKSGHRQRQLHGLTDPGENRVFSTEDGGLDIEPVTAVTCPHCGKRFMPYA